MAYRTSLLVEKWAGMVALGALHALQCKTGITGSLLLWCYCGCSRGYNQGSYESLGSRCTEQVEGLSPSLVETQ